MDAQLKQFYRQFLQQVTNLTHPPSKLLCHPDIQQQLYRYFFDDTTNQHLPPPEYQRKVLKRLVAEIVKEASDENSEVSDELMAHMGYLSSLPEQPDLDVAQSPRVLSYFLPDVPTPSRNTSTYDDTLTTENDVRPVLIRESPRLLAAGTNVGLRTWEACLRLGYYLSTSYERENMKGANVLELGAGTGLLSLICSMVLDAKTVIATDGLTHVISGIEDNIALNAEDSATQSIRPNMPSVRLLDWTEPSQLDEALTADGGIHQVDYVLGADITYYQELHDALSSMLSMLKDRFPECRILLSAPSRVENTMKLWKEACRDRGLTVRYIEGDEWRCPQYWLQTGLFHEQAFPIVLMEIER